MIPKQMLILLLLLSLQCDWSLRRTLLPRVSSLTSTSTSTSSSSRKLSSSSSSSSSIQDVKELTDMFWITPEGLSIEVIAAYSQIAGGTVDRLRRVDERSEVRKWWENTKLFFTNNDNTTPKWSKAPILFIHGSYHAAWCYGEHYLDYFSALGHNCYAISLRGTSGTGMPPNDPGDIVKIEKHIYDIKYALQQIREADDSAPNPIIIAHSFGGLITMKLLEIDEIRNNLSGVALLCSVPPSGNGPMTQRFLQSRFWNSLKIVWGFVLKAATTNVDLCRELFFDNSFKTSDIQRYMRNFRSDSRVGLDLQSLASVLPSVSSINGKAPWLTKSNTSNELELIVNKQNENITNLIPSGITKLTELTLPSVLSQYEKKINVSNTTFTNKQIEVGKKEIKKVPKTSTKLKNIVKKEESLLARLVIGAGKDYIVDDEGVRETALYLDVEPIIIKDLYHDVMLGPKWQQAADEIKKWLESIVID